ncbi:putative short-chain dehydrogenase/oxidoreductase [Pedobacter sp. BAL39]|nr:putative short-chain dehydrogenase/oxidoreductase [Pedobacter sp. BAL39]
MDMKKNNYQGALQQPLGSGFNASSTAAEVINGADLTGKIAVVTGGSAGIGLETVKVLASVGAKVIVPVRSVEKAMKVFQGFPNVELEQMDLMDSKSVDGFVDRFITTERPLHLLINNAGIMWVPLRRDSRGIESQLATNYLGQFQLVSGLWPALKAARGARVINVSSFGHQMSAFNFEDPNFESREYDTLLGYGQSKTASNLFAMELDQRGADLGVRAYSVHPGAVYGTDLGREEPIALFQQMGTYDEHGLIKKEVAERLKTIPQGAATTIWCATSPLLDDIGGVYCEDADIAVLDTGNIGHRYDEPWTLHGVKPYSLDKERAKKLWTLTEKMIGIQFQPF